MPDTEAKPEAATDPTGEAGWAGPGHDPEALEDLVAEVSRGGNLEALIALACEEALAGDPSPGSIRHAGARAAIEAYAAWKRAEGRDVPINVVGLLAEAVHGHVGTEPEPEILPLSLAGKWVAWSSDGMRIVASAETSAEAIRLAEEAGEPEPILEPHPGRYRLS